MKIITIILSFVMTHKRAVIIMFNFEIRLQASVALNTRNQSVLGCLTILSTKLSLLEPSHVELIEARLSSVLQKVTKISEKKLDVQELERTLKVLYYFRL